MLDYTTLEHLFWIFIAHCLMAISLYLVVKVYELRQRLLEQEWLRNQAIRDLYEARNQLVNLTAQDNTGALGYVYVLKSDSGHYKIGKTTNPDARMEKFGVKLPIEVEYLILIRSHGYHQLEARFHQQFKHKRINGEWFSLSTTDLMLLEMYPGSIILEETNNA